MRNGLKKRLLAALLALCMTGGTTLPVYAAGEEADAALEDVFGTSDCEVIVQEAAEDLTEAEEPDAEEADTAAESSAPAEEADTAAESSVPAEEAETEEEPSAPAEEADTEAESSAPAEETDTAAESSAPAEEAETAAESSAPAAETDEEETSSAPAETSAEEAPAEEPSGEEPETGETMTAAAEESEETLQSSAESDAETTVLELRWEKDDAYVESADAGYTYTGKTIKPEYKLWNTKKDKAVKGDYAEVWCLNKKGTKAAAKKNFISCGKVYLFLYEKDEEGEPTGEPVASGYFTIKRKKQTISGVKSSYTKTCGDTLTLKPSAKGELTYSSSDSEVVSVDETGKLSFLTGGTATITVTAARTKNYRKTTKKITVTAEKAENEITVAKTEYSVKYAKKKTFSLTAKAANGEKLTYQSSDTDVVTVSSTGVCTLKGIGKAEITVTTEETDFYQAGSATVSVVSYHRAKKLKYSKSYKKGKYYKALMALKLTGGKRADTVAIALSQLGYHEGRSRSKLSGKASGGGNYTEYGRYYGLTHGAWCAMFVSWCAREAGVSRKVIPKYCAVRSYYSYYHRKGKKFYSWKKIRSGSYKPKQGDLIMYANVKGGTAHHIGYVVSSSYSGKKLTIVTVEGNTKNQVRKVTMKLRKKGSGKINGHYILGVAHPNY